MNSVMNSTMNGTVNRKPAKPCWLGALRLRRPPGTRAVCVLETDA